MFCLIKQNAEGKHPITALHIHNRHVKDKMNENCNVWSLLKYEELLINLLNNQCLKLSSLNPSPLRHIIVG